MGGWEQGVQPVGLQMSREQTAHNVYDAQCRTQCTMWTNRAHATSKPDGPNGDRISGLWGILEDPTREVHIKNHQNFKPLITLVIIILPIIWTCEISWILDAKASLSISSTCLSESVSWLVSSIFIFPSLAVSGLLRISGYCMKAMTNSFHISISKVVFQRVFCKVYFFKVHCSWMYFPKSIFWKCILAKCT